MRCVWYRKAHLFHRARLNINILQREIFCNFKDICFHFVRICLEDNLWTIWVTIGLEVVRENYVVKFIHLLVKRSSQNLFWR